MWQGRPQPCKSSTHSPLARVPHPAQERSSVAAERWRIRTLRKLVPLLHQLLEADVGVQRGDAPDDFRVAQRLRTTDVDEDVEVVRHDAVCPELHAGKLGDAPDEVDKPRALVPVKEVRAVGDATDQVLAPIWKIYPAPSHVEQYIISSRLCGNLLW